MRVRRKSLGHHAALESKDLEAEDARIPKIPKIVVADDAAIAPGHVPSKHRIQPPRRIIRRAFKLCRYVIAGFVFLVLLVSAFLFLVRPYDSAMDPCDGVEADKAFGSDANSKGVIPKIIHQQWKTQTVPMGYFFIWHMEWKRLFPEPEYTHILWDDKMARELIEEKYPWFLSTYDSYSSNIQRADAVRYFILYTYGGLYADLDYTPLQNFWNKLPADRVSLVESPYMFNEQFQNSLMVSPKDDPFWEVVIKALQTSSLKDGVLETTGPQLVDYAVSMASKRNIVVNTLACKNYHRIPLGSASLTSPFITALFRELVSRLGWTRSCGSWKDDRCHYAIHHNSVSWSPISVYQWFY